MMDQFLIPVWETITASWEKVKGSKSSFWAAIIIMLFIAFGFGILITLTESIVVLGSLVNIIATIVNFLLQMGILYIGIQRATDQPISYRMIFHTFEFPVGLRVIGLYILQIIIFIPLVLILIIPSMLANEYAPLGPLAKLLVALCYIIGVGAIIYVAVRMSLAMAFVLNKITNPWHSIKLSFEATKSNFWRLIGIFIIEAILFIISLIPLGIGLIWTLPLFYIVYGMMYKRLLVNVHSL